MPKIDFVKAKVIASNGSVGVYQSGSSGFRTPGATCDGHWWSSQIMLKDYFYRLVVLASLGLILSNQQTLYAIKTE